MNFGLQTALDTCAALTGNQLNFGKTGNNVTQIDMRFAKILRFGRTRNDIGIDLGNLFNTNYATSFENTYQYSAGNSLMGGTWNNPTAIYTARFLRINYTLNF